jgi:hypothetical protein
MYYFTAKCELVRSRSSVLPKPKLSHIFFVVFSKLFLAVTVVGTTVLCKTNFKQQLNVVFNVSS